MRQDPVTIRGWGWDWGRGHCLLFIQFSPFCTANRSMHYISSSIFVHLCVWVGDGVRTSTIRASLSTYTSRRMWCGGCTVVSTSIFPSQPDHHFVRNYYCYYYIMGHFRKFDGEAMDKQYRRHIGTLKRPPTDPIMLGKIMATRTTTGIVVFQV